MAELINIVDTQIYIFGFQNCSFLMKQKDYLEIETVGVIRTRENSIVYTLLTWSGASNRGF